jgi:hypothetical protein
MLSHYWHILQGVEFTVKNPPKVGLTHSTVSFMNSLKLRNNLHGSSTSTFKNLRFLTTEYNDIVIVNDYFPNWSLRDIKEGSFLWGRNGISLYYFIKVNASKNPHAAVLRLPIYSLIQFK